jgi:hypothetical protein
MHLELLSLLRGDSFSLLAIPPSVPQIDHYPIQITIDRSMKPLAARSASFSLA